MGHQEDARLALGVVENMVGEFEESLREGTTLYNAIAREEEPTHIKNYIVGRVLALEDAINRELDMLWPLVYGEKNPQKITAATKANKKRMELRQLAMARSAEADAKKVSPQLIKVPQQVSSK